MIRYCVSRSGIVSECFRLNRIGESLDFVDTNPQPSRLEVLERLRRGEISADDAIKELEELK